MSRWILAATACAFALLEGLAFGQDDFKQVTAAGRAYEQAVKNQDKKALERIIAEDAVFITGDAKKLSRKEMIAGITDKNLRIESVKSEDIQVRVYGDTAIETGRFSMTARAGKEVIRESLLFTDVWVRRAGQWRLVSEHTCNALTR